ncbi:hypothetical protein [Saccharopolyspora sp. NPDC050642]
MNSNRSKAVIITGGALPEEIAWWVLQLTRSEAAYATGVVLPVDGGLAVS